MGKYLKNLSHKGLVSRIYKEKLRNKHNKNWQNFEQIHPEDKLIVDKHMKR